MVNKSFQKQKEEIKIEKKDKGNLEKTSEKKVPIMRWHIFCRVACVIWVLDDDTFLFCGFVTSDSSNKLCAFPTEHRTKNKLDFSAHDCYQKRLK